MAKKYEIPASEVPKVRAAFEVIKMKAGSFNFLDDQEKCRKFIAAIDGEESVKRTDATYMGRYQTRAERIVYAFNNLPEPKDVTDAVKAQAEATTKTRGPALVAVKTSRGTGVIKAIQDIFTTGWFTKDDAFAQLKKQFPERGESMRTTIALNLTAFKKLAHLDVQRRERPRKEGEKRPVLEYHIVNSKLERKAASK